MITAGHYHAASHTFINYLYLYRVYMSPMKVDKDKRRVIIARFGMYLSINRS